MSSLHPTFREPDIQIDDAALYSWKHDQLANAEALLTAAIQESRNPSHHALASRALVRARLRQWDTAIADATQVFIILLSHALSLIYIESIKIQPSVIGYIAKSVALVGNGEKHKAYRTCDIAYVRSHPAHVTYLFLIKVCILCTQRGYSASYIPQAIIVFMAGERDDAISRVDDLIDTVQFNSICYVVQARAHAPPRGEYHH